MEFLTSSLGYVLPFLIALTIIVFIHELGHYLVARWCGVKVEAFSIGFGKELFGWDDKHGTHWKVCWLPLGGYVKFEGDANAASFPEQPADADRVRSKGDFHGKALWQRAAVVAAGPIANFILAIVIFAGLFTFIGLPNNSARVDQVVPGSAAERAGIQSGDLITAVDGVALDNFLDLIQSVRHRGGESVSLSIDRAGTPLQLQIVLDVKVESDGFGGQVKIGQIGIQRAAEGGAALERLSLPEAFVAGAEESWRIVALTFKYLGKVFSGAESPKQIGSFVSIGKGAGDAASSGIGGFFGFIALLSVSVGLLNLFPIPMLDGGHLVYYAIEAVIGKPLSQDAQEWGFRVGLSLVIMLMALGFWNDLTRVFTVISGS